MKKSSTHTKRVPDPHSGPTNDHLLTQAIIDTIRELLIVLDEDLRIVVASRSFYRTFGLTHKNINGKKFYGLGNGQWNIPPFRTLLEKVIPRHAAVEGYEIEHDFPVLGPRTMLVNASEIRYKNSRKKMLLSIFDITKQRALETEREELLAKKNLLLKEMRHRVANSLQIIASILLLKAETVDSKESRSHLEDAHKRIITIATAQKLLDAVEVGENIHVAKYLTALCKSLARSMIAGKKPITIRVNAGGGAVSSDTAVSFGLITTELVINSLKHAFPAGKAGKIIVSYESKKSNWTLSVADDGVGHFKPKEGERRGLGTSIIGALANQLHAIIRRKSSPSGTTVSIVHADL